MASAASELNRGRAAFYRRSWLESFEALSHADQINPLGAEDIWLLAMAAMLIGRDDACIDLLERAHRTHLEAGDIARAVRCTFWLCFRLASRGEMGRASGWLARGQRLLERIDGDCVERGYLLLAVVERYLASGKPEAALVSAEQATAIAWRFADSDLHAFGLHAQGVALLRQVRINDGLALLDEAMLAVTAGELSPVITGIIYCSAISVCRSVYALGRAHEWTEALSKWCEVQPDLLAFTSQCLVHRSEIMQLHGAWRDALEEATRAKQRGTEVDDQQTVGAALYRQAEVHRLLGEFAAAEEAYRQASLLGREPQPGLALLRLAQGDDEAAVAAVRRLIAESTGPLQRARLLPSSIEIMLAVGNIVEARAACSELAEIAQGYESEVLTVIASHAQGATELAAGNPAAALAALRRAWRGWQQLKAPYEAARARALFGLACRGLGDEPAAELELVAARDALSELGAEPDVVWVEALRSNTSRDEIGLTGRELQVLRLVASGSTNKAIANELGISERTVERHVSNIFDKLGISTRTAATAYAYEHRLV